MLTHGVAANGNATLFHHHIPKETGSEIPIAQMLKVSNALKAYHFGNLRIGMHARQHVPTLLQWL